MQSFTYSKNMFRCQLLYSKLFHQKFIIIHSLKCLDYEWTAKRYPNVNVVNCFLNFHDIPGIRGVSRTQHAQNSTGSQNTAETKSTRCRAAQYNCTGELDCYHKAQQPTGDIEKEFQRYPIELHPTTYRERWHSYL